MAQVPFRDLPPSARIWIFSADRRLESAEKDALDAAVSDFLDQWNAHGTPLRGGRDWRYDRFLVVGVDQEAAPPSGCSIDALVRVFKEMEEELGVGLLDRSPVWFRAETGEDGSDGEVRCVSREEFTELAREGRVGPDTVVFDGALTRMDQLQDGSWEIPAKESWHRRLL